MACCSVLEVTSRDNMKYPVSLDAMLDAGETISSVTFASVSPNDGPAVSNEAVVSSETTYYGVKIPADRGFTFDCTGFVAGTGEYKILFDVVLTGGGTLGALVLATVKD